jgi:threo-3-hydroxy-D-aspartate ammonia-lyase
MSMNDLITPALLLDKGKMLKNINKMRDKFKKHGVSLRPHLKTCKSIDVAKYLVPDLEAGKITVSTVAEAEYFSKGGYRDILYAISITPSKLARLHKLQQRGCQITLITDSLAGFQQISDAASKLKTTFPCLIEVDCDGVRAGLKSNDPELLVLAKALHEYPNTELAGVMTHAGGSYNCESLDEIKQMAETERQIVLDAAHAVRGANLPCPIISLGSTPTATYGESFEGITEVRAGVYVFQDLVMQTVGVCKKEDIALSVLATVISHNVPENRILIDAGGLALSKDTGKPNELGHKHFGQVCEAVTGHPIQDLYVSSTNQEHGLLYLDDLPYNFSDFPIGSKLRILPNHACMTAAAYQGYEVLSDNGSISEFYPRCHGW